MKENLILTIDYGTQSVRVSIFNKEGQIIALSKEQYKTPYYSLKVGYAEQDPNFYFECMCRAAKKLSEKHSSLFPLVKGIVLTCFRDTAVLLDKDKKVVRPSILWLDQRQAKCEKKLPLLSRLAFRIVGMSETISLNRKRTIANWIQENEQENWNKTSFYVNISTYLNYKLTGVLKDSAANQSGHYPINFKTGKWYKKDTHLKGQIFGIPKSKLCELVKEGEIIGKVNKEASLLTGIPEGLPLFASGSDKSTDTLGMGVIDEKTASVSYGTASTIDVVSKKYHEPERFLPAYPSCIPNYYNMEVQIYRGYWMLQWFKKEFLNNPDSVEKAIQDTLLFEHLNERMLQISPGSDGLLLQPYWGPGLKRPLARGAIIGFCDVHTKEHVYKAIVEGIAFALREALEHFQKVLHHKITHLMISGGGSQSDAICQITADVFGLPASRVQTYETSSLGAAICGFLAIKEFKTPEEAIKNMVHISKTFQPNMNNHIQYDRIFEHSYLKIYPKLKDIYKELKEFSEKDN